ncbi:Bll6474 protein [Nonlabens ulvanivorans]|uniref:Bll6474 protein n=1 Tax=Nonlabens ulvanivorans TaxID=906888 RepID=A0A081DAD0_NONUL|nr:Bll6474 protein [Nonlabens ulvanivorans]
MNERALWDKYMSCYEEAISNTSTDIAPWYIIPSDDKPMARKIVCDILLQTLESKTHIVMPQLDDNDVEKIDDYIKVLENE